MQAFDFLEQVSVGDQMSPLIVRDFCGFHIALRFSQSPDFFGALAEHEPEQLGSPLIDDFCGQPPFAQGHVVGAGY